MGFAFGEDTFDKIIIWLGHIRWDLHLERTHLMGFAFR